MKIPLDERPLLKMTIDVLTIVFALVSILAGKHKNAERAALAKLEVVTEEREGAHQYAHGLEGQLDDARKDAENYATDGKDKAGIIATLQAQLGEQGQQIGQLTTDLNSLRPGGPVDAVFMIDTTGSTAPYHDHVKEALKALFRWAPRLSSELRIGVIAFRDGPVDIHPLRVIRPRHIDGGRSQDLLLDFVNDLTTQSSRTNHLPVFRKAFEMLGASRGQGRRAVAILVGDVGPSEIDERAGFSSSERQSAARIVDGVRRWVEGDMRTVAAIYLGKATTGSEEREWFRSLSLPNTDHFAADSSEMFNVILSTIER